MKSALPAAIAHAERQQKIHGVLDYIFTHLDQEVTLQTLSQVAHYSPFHLQKLFKEFVGESPKQYALKLRLETAFHVLIIHPHKSIQEVALDGGFSSAAVFSRAMRNYFGHPPEKLRMLSHKAKMKLLHGDTYAHQSIHPHQRLTHTQTDLVPASEHPIIQVIREKPVKGIYQLASFNQPGKIRQAFQALAYYAQTHDVNMKHVSGILAPIQRNIYKAFLPLPQDQLHALPFPRCEIKGGTYATFMVIGDLVQSQKTGHYFIHHWLPRSGYKVAGIEGFETFTGDPASTPYYQLQRQIHIPIEPVL